jgi:Site-specific recombinases, DNA invertase Pin homologs
MVSDIEAKKINLVITKDMSRLGRDYIDTGFYMERYFPEHDVRYISLLDGIDTGSDGYMGDMAPFKAIFNDYYAKDISKKITSVKRDKQRKGLFIGGKAPYGYKKSPTEKNTIVIDEPAAEIVRYIFQLALEGKSCRQIAVILNDENIPTPAAYAKINLSVKGPYSGKWSSERISFMLQNEVYIGSMVQGRVQKISYKSKKCKKISKEKWVVVENTHEPIVDDKTFEKVASLIQSRKRTRSRTYDFLLKGMIFCHECGHPLGVINRPLANGEEVLYFACRTYQRFTKNSACTCHCVRVEDVTNAVLEKVKKICQYYASQLDLDEIAIEAKKNLQDEKRRQGKDLAAFEMQLEKIQLKIDRAYEDKLDGRIDEEMFQRNYKKFKEEQSGLRNKIKSLKESTEPVSFDSKKIKELAEGFLNSKEYDRALLVSLVERIELTENKEVLIYFKFKELDVINHL